MRALLNLFNLVAHIELTQLSTILRALTGASFLAFTLGLPCVLTLSPSTNAQESSIQQPTAQPSELVTEAGSEEKAARSFEHHVKPFLQMYCADCHSGDEPEAGLTLDLEEEPDVASNFESWTAIAEMISDREMPPEDAEQPTDEERQTVEKWIDAGLANFDCSKQPTKPRTTVRRLNRAEYNNAIRDLFGVTVRPADQFPNDEVGEGFDNLGSVLSLPPLLMEKYLDAAKSITDEIKAKESAWQHTFGELSAKQFDAQQAHLSIRDIARRVYRKPVVAEEFNRLKGLYKLAKDNQLNDPEAILFVTQGMLASPQFLFRVEEDVKAVESGEAIPLDSHAIASRLSFFLWSSVPDKKLNTLADRNKLKNPKQIMRQTRRMLKDDKSRAFVENFVGQWLHLRQLSAITPDPERFPAFSDQLRNDMREETYRYVHELLKRNGNILEMLDSDYSYLNADLAKHYGFTGVEGEGFRRVSFEDERRGGILTHGSVLTLTSNPTRTSPVKRGKWILDNVLGTPPPPPPPDVPELEEGDELLGTLRERMQQHRENPSCAVCHRKMDALGFGFENFDAIGAWRIRDGRHEIDASGELPDGSIFTKPAELRQILMSSNQDFTYCLTRKLLTYSLGRVLSSRDKCTVDDIVKQTEKNEHRFADLIVEITTSDAFRFSGYPDADSSE